MKMSVLDLHPEYKPFVGEYYNDNQKTPIKILFIGESHYLPPQYNIDYSEWYNNDTEWFKKKYKIEEKHLLWINTSKIIEEDVIKGIPARAHFIYTQIGDIYGNIFLDNKCYKEALKYIAFSNFFVRPSKGDFLKKDVLVSLDNLLDNITNLNPDKIIFITKKAYNKGFEKYSIKEQKYLCLPSKITTAICHTRFSEWELGYDKCNQPVGRQKLIDTLISIKEKRI